MTTVTVSDKGQVVIPAEIRRYLGIEPGCQLEFTLNGQQIQVQIKRPFNPTQPEDGYGMLVCQPAEPRRLSDFDVAEAMRTPNDCPPDDCS